MELKMLLFANFMVLGFTIGLSDAESYVGCYRDVPNRHYRMNPGAYGESSPTECQELCGSFPDQSYAAMADGNFCFCAATLADSANIVADSLCTSECSDGSMAQCGHQKYVAVYIASRTIEGLELLYDPITSDGIVEIFNPFPFTYQVGSGALDSTVFAFDYGDGSGLTNPNETGMEIKKWSVPGEYVVTVYAGQNDTVESGAKYSKRVLVEAPVKNLTLFCPPAVASYDDFECNATVLFGTNMFADLDYGADGADSRENFTIADASVYRAGPAVPNVDSVNLTNDVATGNTHLLLDSEFLYDGFVDAFVFFTAEDAIPGASFNLMIMSPSCSGGTPVYCHQTRTCEASCPGKYGSTACPADSFCYARDMCTSTCSASTRYQNTPDLYSLSHTVPLTAAAAGQYHHVSLDEALEVFAGDILATDDAVAMKKSPNKPDEAGDRNVDPQTGPSINPHTGSTTNSRKLMAAIYARPSHIKAIHSYQQEGKMNVKLTLCNEHLQNRCINASVEVDVLLGIDYVIIESATAVEEESMLYTGSGCLTELSVRNHTGTNVTYVWDFGDGDMENTTDKTITHTYISKGVYNVTVVASNSITTKENTTIITVEEKLENVSIPNIPAKAGSSHSFQFSADSGSDYACEWDMGDNLAPGSSNETDTPTDGSGAFLYSYASPGVYSVVVNCSNHVGYKEIRFLQVVQHPILGLELTSTGTLMGLDFDLTWIITQGTNVSFNLTFDNSLFFTTETSDLDSLLDFDSLSMEGKTSPRLASYPTTGNKELTMDAWNLVSNESVTINFTIEAMVVDPFSFCDQPVADSECDNWDIDAGDTITFSAGATSGTSISIEWYWCGDLTPTDFVSAALEPWPPASPQVVGNAAVEPHLFSMPGVCNVTVVVKNNFNITEFSHTVNVYNRIENLTLQCDDAVEFLYGFGEIDCWFESFGTPPTRPYVVWDWGDGQVTDREPLALSPAVTTHRYLSAGDFPVAATVSNLVSSEDYSATVTTVEPVVNLLLVFDPPHLVVGATFNLDVSMEKGSGVQITIDWDDGSPLEQYMRTGSDPWSKDTSTKSIPTVGFYTITVTASNILGNTTKQYVMAVQDPVNPEDFTFTCDPPTFFNSVAGNDIGCSLEFTGGTLPTDPSMTIDYGTGEPSTDEAFPFSAPGPWPTPFTLTRSYTQPGAFVVSLTIKTLSSSHTFTFNVGVYEPIGSVSCEVLWSRIPGSGLFDRGLGPNYDVFRTDKELILNMTFEGTVRDWRVASVMNNGEALQVCNHSTQPIALSLQTGSWQIEATAWNELGNASHSCSPITVIQVPDGLVVTDDGITSKPREQKIFKVSFTELSEDTCLVMDWGEGDSSSLYANDPACSAKHANLPIEGNVNSTMELVHTYAKKGFYTASANASNDYWETSWELSFPVSKKDCNSPKLSIPDGGDIANPKEYKRSEQFIIKGSTNLDCSVTFANDKWWTIELLDDTDSDYPVRSVIDWSHYSASNAELALYARTLQIGLYRMTYGVIMVHNSFTNKEKFSSTAEVYVKITESELMAALAPFGQSLQTVGINTLLNLDGYSYSNDPDVNPGEPKGFESYTWRCREATEAAPTPDTVTSQLPLDDPATVSGPGLGGCFGGGPGIIDTTAATLTITTAHMEVNKTYVFDMTVHKGSRQTTTTYSITVVEGSPMELQISCTNLGTCVPDNGGLRVNPSSQVKFHTVFPDLDTNCPSDVYFQWTMERKGLADSWILVEDLETVIVGSHSCEIAVLVELFLRGYEMHPLLNTYRLSLTATSTDGSISQTSTILNLNTPPTGGVCSVSETEAIEFETMVKLNCTGFYDPDEIAKYKFYITVKDDQVTKVLSFTSKSYTVTQLPRGPLYDNYTLSLWVKIIDSKGSFNLTFIGNVRCTARSHAQLQASIADLRNPQSNPWKIASQGDNYESNLALQGCLTAINSAADYDREAYPDISIASMNQPTGYGVHSLYDPLIGDINYIANGSADTEKELRIQYEIQRSERAELRLKVMKYFVNSTVETTGDMSPMLSTMDELHKHPEEVGYNTQRLSTDLLVRLYDTLETLADNTPKEELLDISVVFLQVCGQSLVAQIKSREEPIILDIEETKDGEFDYYDTSWESEKLAFQGMDADTAASLNYKESAGFRQADLMDTIIGETFTRFTGVMGFVGSSMVAGEAPVKLVTPALSGSVYKNSAANITAIARDEAGSSVNFPSWCGMRNTSVCDENEVITLIIAETAVNPFGNVANALDVPTEAKTLTLEFRDKEGNIISIEDSTEPLTFSLTRDITDVDFEEENVTAVIPDRSDAHHFYHTFPVNQSQASLHFDIIPEDKSVQFLVLLGFGDYPDLNRTNISEANWNYLTMIPHNHSKVVDDEANGRDLDMSQFRLFVDNVKMNNFQGEVKIGVRQMEESEFDLYTEDSKPPIPGDRTGRITTWYTISGFVSGCYYISAKDGYRSWKSTGMVVLPETTREQTYCSSNHLTTFAGGFAVAPNKIDFNFIFSNLDFYKNMTLYITEILIAVLFIFTAIWARRADSKDVEKLGVTPLPDNDPKDKYLYEIQVSTGSRKNAATDSKVHLILSGEYDETDVRVLEDPKRKILRRGNTDNFLLTTSSPLGPVQYARIWHDNSGKGKFQGWYCRYMVVHDLQTKEKFFFIINEWFAVEESDGQIDRLVPVAGQDNMVQFNVLFSQKTRKNLSDEHLWFSVVARPPQSRFTRLQRVSCCLMLLFTSMLADAMFYDKLPEGGNNQFSIGPFALSPEQIYVGVIVNLIVFPINFLVVILFRKSRPRNKRPSRIQDALKKCNYSSGDSRAASTEPSSDKRQLVNDDSPTVESQFSAIGSRSSTPQLLSHVQPLQPAHQPNMTTLNMDTFAKSQKKEDKKKKKKPFSLPWWFRIVAWVLLILVVAACAAFVTFYGIQFGDMKCKKWITSMVIAFITSIFLTQPVKVFLVAFLFSMFFKKMDMEEDGEEDEEDIQLQTDETWLHQYPPPDPDGYIMPTRERKIAYNPPDPEILNKARENRLKELKMYDILREILFYSMFVWILLVVSYGFRDPNAALMKKGLDNLFIDSGLGKVSDVSSGDNDFRKARNSRSNGDNNFRKAVTYDNYWNWLRGTMMPALRAGKWYNGQNALFQRGMIGDRYSRMMGYATLRQLRVKPDKCKLQVEQLSSQGLRCEAKYSILDEETREHGVGWTPLQTNGTWNNSKPEYVYRTGPELDSYPFWAKHAMYSGGGYVVELRGSENAILAKIEELIADEWADLHTRAIFLEFTVYNANVNLFGITTIVAEFIVSGGIHTSQRIEPMNLLGHISSVSIFTLVCQILYLLFILFFIGKEIRNLIREKGQYFKQFWNWVEICIIVLSIACVTIYFYRWYYASQLTALFKIYHGNSYIKFQYCGYWNEVLLYFLGLLCFLGTIKFIKLLRFNRRMGMLASTLRIGAKPMFLFLVMFMIMFMAYAQFFYLIYHERIDNFRTIITTMETLLQMLVGKFNFNAMKSADPIMGPLVFFFYVVTVFYILINMFLSILNESFAAVRLDITLQTNDHEMVQFIMNRFKQWTGLQAVIAGKSGPSAPEPEEQVPIEQQLKAFPEKVDRLLDVLCKAYINSDYFDAMFDSNSEEGKAAMKNLIRGSKNTKAYSGIGGGSFGGAAATGGAFGGMGKDNGMPTIEEL